MPQEVDGLDITKGIGYFSGDRGIYFEVLCSYAESLPSLLNKITNVDDLQKYAVVIHGIKGSSYGICADSIAEQAEALESAADAGDYEFVIKNNPPFLEAAWDLLSRIKEKGGILK
jgi:hypothetical protein